MKPTILAIETATSACSVALTRNEQVFQQFEVIPQQHTQQIFPMIQRLMAEANITLANLDAIAVGHGPGSFTGLRIAVTVAQGLAYALNKPVYGFSTLAAMAYQVSEKLTPNQTAIVLASLDARMQERYAGLYRVSANTLETLQADRLFSNQAFETWQCSLEEPIWHVCDDEQAPLWAKNTLVLAKQKVYPRAKEIVLMARQAWLNADPGHSPEDIVPIYLRDEVAKIPQKNRSVIDLPTD